LRGTLKIEFVGKQRGMQVCKQTGKEYTTQLHVSDLKDITKAVGFNLHDEQGNSLLDYSPEGKRDLLAIAHLKARKESGKYFG